LPTISCCRSTSVHPGWVSFLTSDSLIEGSSFNYQDTFAKWNQQEPYAAMVVFCLQQHLQPPSPISDTKWNHFMNILLTRMHTCKIFIIVTRFQATEKFTRIFIRPETKFTMFILYWQRNHLIPRHHKNSQYPIMLFTHATIIWMYTVHNASHKVQWMCSDSLVNHHCYKVVHLSVQQ